MLHVADREIPSIIYSLMLINSILITYAKSPWLNSKHNISTQWDSKPRFPEIKQSVIRSYVLYQLIHFYHIPFKQISYQYICTMLHVADQEIPSIIYSLMLINCIIITFAKLPWLNSKHKLYIYIYIGRNETNIKQKSSG